VSFKRNLSESILLNALTKKAAAKAKKKVAEEKKTHVVTDVEDAKDYLAETYGVSRSKMKTKEDILAIAKEKGVELEGLE
jgi:hypothetical protein